MCSLASFSFKKKTIDANEIEKKNDWENIWKITMTHTKPFRDGKGSTVGGNKIIKWKIFCLLITRSLSMNNYRFFISLFFFFKLSIFKLLHSQVGWHKKDFSLLFCDFVSFLILISIGVTQFSFSEILLNSVLSTIEETICQTGMAATQ